MIADFEKPVAHIGGHVIRMLETYGRAKPGEMLALINSFGVVEVAKAREARPKAWDWSAAPQLRWTPAEANPDIAPVGA